MFYQKCIQSLEVLTGSVRCRSAAYAAACSYCALRCSSNVYELHYLWDAKCTTIHSQSASVCDRLALLNT